MLKIKRVFLIVLLNLLHCVKCSVFDEDLEANISYLSRKMDTCSEYFQYQRIDDFINGKLELFNMKIGDTVKMTFYKVDFDKHPRFNGIFLPDESSQTIIDRIQNGQLITYRIDFPVTPIVPKLIKIFINGNELCATKHYATGEILELEHTLEIINGSLPVFKYNINIPKFAATEIAIDGLTPLIHRGREIRRGEYPWLTAINKRQRSRLSFICGGSLVTSSIILTAAHCFQGSSLNVTKIVAMLGRHNLTNYKEDGFVMRQIKTLILHPEYKYEKGFSDADLALLEMKNHVSFTTFIQPICLWNKLADESLIVNHSGVVAGWGDDDEGVAISRVPKKVKMNIVSEAVCLRSSVAFNGLSSTRTLCAGNRDGSGPCEGDSGGGLMIYQNGHWMLRAVVSAGLLSKQRCNLLEYTVYCDIAKHMSWLKNYIDQSVTTNRDSTGAVCGKSDIDRQKQQIMMSVENICGKSDMEYRSAHPWLAAIYIKAYTGEIFAYTGALITSRMVLAPAHGFIRTDGDYFSPDEFRIYLGRYDLNNIQENGVMTRDVETLIFHPDYILSSESTLKENNLILIEMAAPVSFTEYVKPICLWSEPDAGQAVAKTATIASWESLGVYNESTTVPTSIELNITSMQRCESFGYNETTSARILCIPRQENKNGGILMIKRKERWFLRGIDALDNDSDEYLLKDHFVYSDIAKYLTWILENIEP